MDWAVRSQVWIQESAASLSLGVHICEMGLMPPTVSVSIMGTDEGNEYKPPARAWLRAGTQDMGLSLWGASKATQT